MKIKLFISILVILVFTGACAESSYASQTASQSSAQLQTTLQPQEDVHARILRAFLERYDSPLVDSSYDFVENARKYDLDWKLVAAIAGVESTFGKHIPYNSYNGWGWGVYGDNVIRFSSWNEGIQTVSRGLRENYINKWGATDVYSIGKIYAASPAWPRSVTFYMNQIEKFKLSDLKNTLPLSL